MNVDSQNPLHYPDCLFATKKAAIGTVDGGVGYLSPRWVYCFEQLGPMALVLGVLKVDEEALA